MTERVQITILGLLAMVILVIGAGQIPGAQPMSEQATRVFDLLVGGLIGALGGYAVGRAARRPGAPDQEDEG